MLTLFNRYITRLSVDHQVFAKREVFLLILSFLEGEDLATCANVCYFWRVVVRSEPTVEVKVLRYRMSVSNEQIRKLTQPKEEKPPLVPQLPTFQPTQFPIRKPPPKPEPKWENFKKSFFQYAQEHGFELRRDDSFATIADRTRYHHELAMFYSTFVDHLKKVEQGNTQPTVVETLSRKSRSLWARLSNHMHMFIYDKYY